MHSRRAFRLFMIAFLVTAGAVVAYAAGFGTAWLLVRDRTPSADEAAGFGLFWEAWHLVEDHFYSELPDVQHLAWAAIRGGLAALDDPYTSFLEPQPRQREKEDLSGRFGGIGAVVSQAEDGSIVLDPMPDLPAEKAGIQEGDIVVMVDDTEITSGMTPSDVAGLVRGEIGTMVRLTLRRPGEDTLIVVEIERQEIPSPSLEWRMLDVGDGLGLVRVTLFTGRTGTELREALEDLADQGLRGLILDLRGNGGGLLGSAIDVASEFLDGGVVLYQVGKGSQEQTEEASRGGSYTEGPLVVLVDGGTASASEIVAGALQDRGRAILVGQKTFGKGLVQSVFDLSDGSSVHVTSAQWLTPNRHEITGQGLLPDLLVEITEEDRSQGLDPQLERAIEHLSAVP